MKAPQAQKGTAGIPKRPSAPSSTSNPAIKQIGPSLFHVKGSANKPYVVDLQGSDIRSSKKTPKCTCPNWATVRNRMVGADPLNNFTGYSCKHIAEVLRTVGNTQTPSREEAAKAKKLSDAQVKKMRDAVLADFLR